MGQVNGLNKEACLLQCGLQPCSLLRTHSEQRKGKIRAGSLSLELGHRILVLVPPDSDSVAAVTPDIFPPLLAPQLLHIHGLQSFSPQSQKPVPIFRWYQPPSLWRPGTGLWLLGRYFCRIHFYKTSFLGQKPRAFCNSDRY